MAFEQEKFNLDEIKRKYNISQASIDGIHLKKDELEQIYVDYKSHMSELENYRNEIMSYLNKELVGCIHSIRGRVKDPEHLIEKIIRNINEKPDKYETLNINNYQKIITDLVGIRIIILDKRQWQDVHNTLLKIFNNDTERYAKDPHDIEFFYDKYKQEFDEKSVSINKAYHAEPPTVYITTEDDRLIYKGDSLIVNNSKSYYRSIHYIIRYSKVYFEIQVRTLFEEGWLEFDHQIKYPYDQHNKKKQEYANILNSLAVAADRLISFYEEDSFTGTNHEKEEKKESVINELDCENDAINLNDKIKKRY